MKVNTAIGRNRGKGLQIKCTLIVIFFTVIMLIGTAGFSQSNYHLISRIDNIVQQADSLANKSQKTFYLNKIHNVFDGVKETWNYTMVNGRVIVFQVRYVLDSIEYTEIYYLNKGNLIYSEEYETIYYTSTGDDEIKWGGIYYFVSNVVKQGVTLGDKRRRNQFWNKGHDTFARFQRRFSELQQNIPLTARNSN
jgi:hypothetical protein